jgi:hypothetical protein
LAGDLGPAVAHRDTDIGGAERRPVVDAVACHGHGVAKALQTLDDPQLVQWCSSGDDRRLLQASVEPGVVEPSDLDSGEDSMVTDGQAGFTGDRSGRGGVIARDHDHPDARIVAAGHGCCHGWPEWVTEPE